MVWFNTPPYDDYFPCRFLIDSLPHEFYAERYEISERAGRLIIMCQCAFATIGVTLAPCCRGPVPIEVT